MVFLKVVLVGLASPRGLTVQCFPQEYFSPTPPFHFRCVGPYVISRDRGRHSEPDYGLGNRTHTTQKYNILPQSTTSDFARRA